MPAVFCADPETGVFVQRSSVSFSLLFVVVVFHPGFVPTVSVWFDHVYNETIGNDL